MKTLEHYKSSLSNTPKYVSFGKSLIFKLSFIKRTSNSLTFSPLPPNTILYRCLLFHQRRFLTMSKCSFINGTFTKAMLSMESARNMTARIFQMLRFGLFKFRKIISLIVVAPAFNTSREYCSPFLLLNVFS